MSRVPEYEQYTAAMRNRTAELLCFEAIGYVRGWCDARGGGAGEAIDFGRAFAVLVAAGGSRPNIADAWTNWCHGRHIGAGPEFTDTPPATIRP